MDDALREVEGVLILEACAGGLVFWACQGGNVGREGVDGVGDAGCCAGG